MSKGRPHESRTQQRGGTNPDAAPIRRAAGVSQRNFPFWLVDVFAREPLSGNGLSVFLLDAELPASMMQQITQEMRQFETIFLRPLGASTFDARIFTMEEELSFAGHPVIGAAAVMHAAFFASDEVAGLEFVIHDRSIAVTSRREGEKTYLAEMDQGAATIDEPIAQAKTAELLEALNLRTEDLAAGLPLQVISTGLPYLIVPVRANLERARIVVPGFEALLATVGAKFVYVLDVGRREGRTWDNDGRVEDIATGSAAGPAAAYLVAHGLAVHDEVITLAQGRFLGRPSELHAIVRGAAGVVVRGRVCFVGDGALRLAIPR
jgi:PhzF family phenazine biosynthesis protein